MADNCSHLYTIHNVIPVYHLPLPFPDDTDDLMPELPQDQQSPVSLVQMSFDRLLFHESLSDVLPTVPHNFLLKTLHQNALARFLLSESAGCILNVILNLQIYRNHCMAFPKTPSLNLIYQN